MIVRNLSLENVLIGTQQTRTQRASVNTITVLPQMVRLRGMPRRERVTSAEARPRDDLRLQKVQKVFPEGRTGL